MNLIELKKWNEKMVLEEGTRQRKIHDLLFFILVLCHIHKDTEWRRNNATKEEKMNV